MKIFDSEEVLPVICTGNRDVRYSRNQHSTMVEDITHPDGTGVAPSKRSINLKDIEGHPSTDHSSHFFAWVGRLINALGR
ncbi:hypothetical protein [Frateuria aurantia]|uniref:hypothetical protein n=1 Tax=Frateuria aurantia TaxID=81475 RepID=UPI001FDF8231|nr:hypothetical protein [Frateuria aurantia]